MRKNVLAQEEQNRLNFERLQQAALLKAEAKDLEEKAKRNEKSGKNPFCVFATLFLNEEFTRE